MSTLLIKNARIIDFFTNRDEVANILIEDKKIKEITTRDICADNIIDASGLVAIPGLVDMHVHLRDPGQTEKEDIITGCKSASAGGVTSILAMPNTNPTIDNVETIEYIKKKAENATAKVYISCAITKGLKSETLTDIEQLNKAGAIALTDDGRPVENIKYLARALKIANELNMSVTAHCEDLDLAKDGIINKGKISEKLGVSGIPSSAEDVGTAREIMLAELYDVPVHICHVSTKTSVEIIRSAKKRGVKVTAETAPHYFTLTEEELLKKDADYRMNPPLRTHEDKQAIIEGLIDGTLDAIATDHAPHTVEQKSNFVKAPNGAIGMETSFSASYTALVKTGKLTLKQLVEKMSYNPAKILNIEAGVLDVSKYADIVLIDLNKEYIVDENKLNGKSKNTPFKGLTLTSKVKTTILNGDIVYNDVT